MSIPIHRDTDSRICGATTIAGKQTTVFANGLLVAVDGDGNSHGGGNLIAGSNNVFVENIAVVNDSADAAYPDSLCPAGPHCSPYTSSGSPDVFVGD